jgi:glycosyltransferase involved in cell wall biosynthesis
MRIAVLIREPILYRAPTALSLADILAEAGCEAHVFNPADRQTLATHGMRSVRLDGYDAIFPRRLGNLEYWLRAVPRYLGFDAVIALDTQGFVAAWLIKRVLPQTILVSYCTELNLPWEQPFSFSIRFSKSRFARADLFVDVEKHRAAYRVQRFRLPHRPYVIVNAPRLSEAAVGSPSKPAELQTLPGLALLYQGALGEFQAVDRVIRGLAESTALVSLYICAYGPEWRRKMLKDLAASLGVSDRVGFLEPRSRASLRSLTMGADIGIAFYPFRESWTLNKMYCAPSKVFDYMAAGLPVIVSDNPSLKEWVEREGWGICVSPEDPRTVGRAIDRLASDSERRERMSQRALDVFRHKYNLDIQARAFVAEVLSLHRSRRGGSVFSSAGHARGPSRGKCGKCGKTGHAGPLVAVAQLGSRMHYAVPLALYRGGILGRFYTDSYVTGRTVRSLLETAHRLRPLRPLVRLRDRSVADLPRRVVTAFHGLGIRYYLRLRRASHPAAATAVHLWAGRVFCRKVIRSGLRSADAVYGFASASKELFEFAKGGGTKCILDQMAIMELYYHLWEEEAARWRGWEEPPTLGEANWAFFRREDEERELADLILCPSDFVVRFVASKGGAAEKCRVVPYGVNLSGFRCERSPYVGGRPLRILFVGRVSLMKGLPYLLEAVKRLKSRNIEVRLVGEIALAENAIAPYRRLCRFLGPVARSEVLRHYAWADILVLPTLCEGLALVQLEAMAAGVPVIATPNAGNVVRDGVDGFVVPIRDAEAIAEKIEYLAQRPEVLREMSHSARKQAEEFSLEKYGERLIKAIRSLF